MTVTVPGSGMTSADGSGTLTCPGVTETYTTGSFSTAAPAAAAGQLGYLPMTWTSKSRTAVSPTNAQAELAAAYQAPAGTFSWQGGYPSNLTDQWKAGSGNMLDVGAVRAFESVTGLTMDGMRRPHGVVRPARRGGQGQGQPQRLHLRAGRARTPRRR